MDAATGEKRSAPAYTLFIFIGARPHTDWVAGLVERDLAGFIPTGPGLMRGGQRLKGWRLDRDPTCWRPACPESSRPGMFVSGR